METSLRILLRIRLVAIAAGALWLAGFAAAANNEQNSLHPSDRTFMRKAAKGGMLEVAMGKLAEEHATNADVKAFGQRMVTDHSKANDKLKSIAQMKGVTLSSSKAPVKWTSDKAYMNTMVKDHEEDLAEFQKEAREAKDPDLRQFAEQTAKMVQEHLDLAKNTQGKLD
jgi:putative membrane protein